MSYRAVNYHFNKFSHVGATFPKDAEKEELFEQGLILDGVKAEEMLIGAVKTRNDIHGALSSEQFCDMALREADQEANVPGYLAAVIRKALVDFGQQVIDRVGDRVSFFLKHGYLTLEQFAAIKAGHPPAPYELGQRGMRIDKDLLETVHEMKIGYTAVKYRNRLKGITHEIPLLYNVGKLEDEMAILRKSQFADPSNPDAPLGRSLITDVRMALEKRKGATARPKTLEERGMELRFFSSSQTLVDFAGGLDCWLELYNQEKGSVLDTFAVDITHNGEKRRRIHHNSHSGSHGTPDGENGNMKLADYIFFYSQKDIELAVDRGEFSWSANMELYENSSYKGLIKAAAQRFRPYIS